MVKLDLFFIEWQIPVLKPIASNPNNSINFSSFIIQNGDVYFDEEIYNSYHFNEQMKKFIYQTSGENEEEKKQLFLRRVALNYSTHKTHKISNIEVDPTGSTLFYCILKSQTGKIKVLVFQQIITIQISKDIDVYDKITKHIGTYQRGIKQYTYDIRQLTSASDEMKYYPNFPNEPGKFFLENDLNDKYQLIDFGFHHGTSDMFLYSVSKAIPELILKLKNYYIEHKRYVDNDFLYRILGLTAKRPITGDKTIDIKILSEIDHEKLLYISETNLYVKNLINTNEFLVEYLTYRNYPLNILEDMIPKRLYSTKTSLSGKTIYIPIYVSASSVDEYKRFEMDKELIRLYNYILSFGKTEFKRFEIEGMRVYSYNNYRSSYTEAEFKKYEEDKEIIYLYNKPVTFIEFFKNIMDILKYGILITPRTDSTYRIDGWKIDFTLDKEYFNTLKYLIFNIDYKTYKIIYININYLISFIELKLNDIVEFVINNLFLSSDDDDLNEKIASLNSIAVEMGDVEIFKLVNDKFDTYVRQFDLLIEIVKNGNIDMFDYYYTQKYKYNIDESIVEIAEEEGHYELTQHMRETYL